MRIRCLWVQVIKKSLKVVPRRFDQEISGICSHAGQRIKLSKRKGCGIVAVQHEVSGVHSPLQSKLTQWLTIMAMAPMFDDSNVATAAVK